MVGNINDDREIYTTIVTVRISSVAFILFYGREIQ